MYQYHQLEHLYFNLKALISLKKNAFKSMEFSFLSIILYRLNKFNE